MNIEAGEKLERRMWRLGRIWFFGFPLLMALLIAGALAGCGGDTWDQPGASTADFAKAEYVCQRDALQNGGIVVAYGVARRTSDRGLYRMCMQAHGWNRVRG